MNRELSESELNLVALEVEKDVVKEFYDRYEKGVQAVIDEHGVNHLFQDSTGVVYKTVQPEGRFVRFDKYAVNRTRREGEAKGSLSLSEAREAGFVVEGK